MTSRDKLVIYLILASAFVVMLNETMLGVALPVIMADLGLAASTVQWLVTGVMLTMAVVIPLSGYFLRRFTTRQVYLTSLVIFTVGTILAALAPGFGILLAARVVQAAGTGVMVPLLTTTIMTLVPPRERGKMMGNITIVMAAAPALGPFAAGAALSVFEWRMLFWFVVPVGVLALALGQVKMVNITATARIGLDVVSIPLSGFAFGGLVYGLSSIGDAARGAYLLVDPWVPLTVGVAALGGFVWRQLVLQRRDAPLMDLRVFVQPGFATAIGLLGVVAAILFGAILILPIYIQSGLGRPALVAGLAVLPGGLIQGLAGPFVGRLYDRVGPKPLLVPATVVISATLGGFAVLLGTNTAVWVIVCLHVVLSLALAFTFPPMMNSAMGALPPALYPSGSAVVGTWQQLFGAAGTAGSVVVYTLGLNAATSGPPSAAVVAGAHLAFTTVALGSLIAIVFAALIRRPANELAPPV
jgi:DHA2 family lincomycin resistance protein-like MFS transporter